MYDNYLRGIVTVEKYIECNTTIFCIIDEIQQTFKNIIFNAIQAMYLSESKVLSIKFSSKLYNEKSTLLIEFEDTGHGVNQDVVHKLFTAFFTTKSRGEGIGLGLYVSKTIAKEHGGDLYYEQREIGSKFTLELSLG